MGNITQVELCFSRASFLLHFATSLPLLYILMGHRLYFPTKIIFISLNIALILANSAGICKTLHYMAFHLRLHCLAKYPFMVLQYTRFYPLVYVHIT